MKILSATGCAAVLACLACACSAPMERPSFHAATPKARAAAVAEAASAKDAAAVPDLIEALDDDDPVVRSWGIRALEGITGQTLGYDPYGSQGARDDAVDRWVAWRLGADQSDTVPGAGGPSSGPAGADTP